MKIAKKRSVTLAITLSVMMHLILFVVVRPVPGDSFVSLQQPPHTQHLGRSDSDRTIHVNDARVVWSPLLFSLPSEVGFSADSLQKKPYIFPIDLPLVESVNFLEVRIPLSYSGLNNFAAEFMLTAPDNRSPKLPVREFAAQGPPSSTRRIYVAPELKKRMLGGIVFPPELNKKAEKAWELHASVSISKQGVVKHVFLDRPMESAKLNTDLLRLLSGLRFKPGAKSVDGRIEIYSPETVMDKGGE